MTIKRATKLKLRVADAGKHLRLAVTATIAGKTVTSTSKTITIKKQ